MELKKYKHKAQYYETDQMGVVHHSNYIRWFEESRVDLLEQIGFSYDKMEEAGIVSPVLAVTAEYILVTRFAEEVFIIPRISSFNGLKFTVSYEVRSAESNELKAAGESRHCFLDSSFKPVRLKKDFPDVYKLFMDMLNHEG